MGIDGVILLKMILSTSINVITNVVIRQLVQAIVLGKVFKIQSMIHLFMTVVLWRHINCFCY